MTESLKAYRITIANNQRANSVSRRPCETRSDATTTGGDSITEPTVGEGVPRTAEAGAKGASRATEIANREDNPAQDLYTERDEVTGVHGTGGTALTMTSTRMRRPRVRADSKWSRKGRSTETGRNESSNRDREDRKLEPRGPDGSRRAEDDVLSGSTRTNGNAGPST